VDEVLQFIDFHLSGGEFLFGFPVGKLHRALLTLHGVLDVAAAIKHALSDAQIYSSYGDETSTPCAHRFRFDLVQLTFRDNHASAALRHDTG